MKVGFIGLGNMGNPMASNLIKAGHQLTVHDLRREAATNLLEMGAEWADTPKDTVPGQDLVLTSLPVPRDVEAVVLGENGILEGTSQGDVYMDLSTNSPTTIRRLHDIGAERGVNVLDAPVSGGVYGAAAATLAVMVGGDEAIYNRMKPTLDAIGSHVVYCGPIGNGMVCKICNNLISMGTGVLLTEALTLGVKGGVDLAVLADVIANSSGGCRRITEKFPRYLFKGNFEPGFATALAAKDVRLATDLGREYGIPMELSDLVDQRHVEAMLRGWGPEDSDAV
ncbi:MAG: NAD(P)-dependent oxidoreductase, partial [Dehalococcoidia bacterium]